MTNDAGNGPLDGLVILRFGHISRNPLAGGMEQYLDKLNRALLERNCVTIIQTHHIAAEDPQPAEWEEERIGRGRLVWVATKGEPVPRRQLLLPANLRRAWRASKTSGGRAGKAGGLYHYFRNACLFSHDEVLRAFDRFPISLVAFHWLNFDADPLIARAVRDHIPFVVVNHFDNRRYALPGVRRQIRRASGLAGISGQNVPADLNGYVNLSDGLDTNFFDPALAKLIPQKMELPIVFLPSRVVPGKGHADLIRAAGWLGERGLKVALVFAGEVSEELRGELRGLAAQLGLQDRVVFLGRIALESLRDWYAASRVTVLPSYWEGLGRTLIEAQAMRKPVVAYKSGGIVEAVVDGKTGHLVQTGDWNAMGVKLKDLLTDENAASRMGAAGREFVLTQFSMPAFVRRHEEFYRRGISDPRLTSKTAAEAPGPRRSRGLEAT